MRFIQMRKCNPVAYCLALPKLMIAGKMGLGNGQFRIMPFPHIVYMSLLMQSGRKEGSTRSKSVCSAIKDVCCYKNVRLNLECNQ
jgi:hypothetical protein